MLFTPFVLLWPIFTILLAIILNLKKPLVKGILSKLELGVTIIGNTSFIFALSVNFLTFRIEMFVSGFYYLLLTVIALDLFMRSKKACSSIHRNISYRQGLGLTG